MEITKLILGITTLLGAGLIGAVSIHHADHTPPEIIRFAAINAADQVRDALSRNPGQINAVDQNGETALNIAAYRGYPEIVDLLISSGAEIDRPDKDGYTPLAEAILSGGQVQTRRAIVKSLLTAGANPKFALPDGHTIVDLAVSLRGENSHLVSLLRGESAKSARRVAVASE
jgi:ankyrin repeat protein